MKVCVLSGSPKGAYSVTYQTVRYLELKYKKDSFEILHVGQKIRSVEKDIAPYLAAMQKADLLLFCYPVYTFIVPYQLHRFIELVKASGVDLSGRACAQITTSKHFYDVTAHNFIKENAIDLGLHYVGGLSADMEDLLTAKGRKEAETFWGIVHFKTENGIYENAFKMNSTPPLPYVSSGAVSEKRDGMEAVIVANLKEGDADLRTMIDDFCSQYPHRTRLVNLNEYRFSGGCLGCFNCATSGKCIYKDGFDDFLRNEIQTGATIVYAFRIEDHSMGSRMKLYDDRQFCNGHRTVTAGMPIGYLIRGDLSCEYNLQTIIEGRAQVGGNYLAGVATDENGVTALVKNLTYALENKVVQPPNFLGVGGMKIFRDLIWIVQGMMKEDHKFYKKHGFYDFPQKQRKNILKMKLVGALMSNPKMKAKMGNKINEGMLRPYTKMLQSLEK